MGKLRKVAKNKRKMNLIRNMVVKNNFRTIQCSLFQIVNYSNKLDPLVNRKCPNCAKECKDLFLCSWCGSLKDPLEMKNAFQVFDIDVKYNVDLSQLSQKFKTLQKKLHPDKFATMPKEIKDNAEQHSSIVNNAYG